MCVHKQACANYVGGCEDSTSFQQTCFDPWWTNGVPENFKARCCGYIYREEDTEYRATWRSVFINCVFI